MFATGKGQQSLGWTDALLYLKWITYEDLLYSTGILLNLLPACMGEGLGGEWIHVYVYESLCCSLGTITLLIGYILQYRNVFGV